MKDHTWKQMSYAFLIVLFFSSLIVLHCLKTTQPCRDVDRRRMFPASGLSAGNFALKFPVSVRCETETEQAKWLQITSQVSLRLFLKKRKKKKVHAQKKKANLAAIIIFLQCFFYEQCDCFSEKTTSGQQRVMLFITLFHDIRTKFNS